MPDGQGENEADASASSAKTHKNLPGPALAFLR